MKIAFPLLYEKELTLAFVQVIKYIHYVCK